MRFCSPRNFFPTPHPTFQNLARVLTSARSSFAVTELLKGAAEAEDMLLHQLVQGKRKGEGEYELNVENRHITMEDPTNSGPASR
jgi:hypothetical protein